jgi:hypothetical protein
MAGLASVIHALPARTVRASVDARNKSNKSGHDRQNVFQ